MIAEALPKRVVAHLILCDYLSIAGGSLHGGAGLALADTAGQSVCTSSARGRTHHHD